MLDLTVGDVCVLTYASAGEGLEKFRAAVHVRKWPYSHFFYFFSFLSFLCHVSSYVCDFIKKIFLYIFNIIAILLTLSISPFFFFLHCLIYPSLLPPPSLSFCKSPFRHLRVFS